MTKLYWDSIDVHQRFMWSNDDITVYFFSEIEIASVPFASNNQRKEKAKIILTYQ